MGAAEDVLRARAEAKKAAEAKELERSLQLTIRELREEITTSVTWLEENNWPGGELRFYSSDNREERAMWPLREKSLLETNHNGKYVDSLGNLIEITGSHIRVLDDEHLQQYTPANIQKYIIEPVKAIRDLPIE